MVEPTGHRPQTQPITVALRNICQDYPAGGGVLRELLQNADDAGASTVRFVLDQTNYPTVTLANVGVQEFQGPALLAYNDSVFSDEDFGSLSRVGDSYKQKDGSKTGKFGRGFNAVYNWTDSPSIISRKSLLILDPHQKWSQSGGPYYDFVAQVKAGNMVDQMKAFSAITQEFDSPFQGTIIRIPLRTPEQAKESQICDRAASISEIAQVMHNFVDDFGHTGLLFIKNVSKLSVEIGGQAPIFIRIGNYEEVRKNKIMINNAIKKALSSRMSNFTTSFEVEIMSGPPHKEQEFRFAVHHSIQNYPEVESLREWSEREAMVPWVAVASEIRTNETEVKSCSIFNVLPSPIRINQPVHIHGCFGMSPDRAQLHGIGDSSVQYPLSGEWNRWLFEGLIPTAWANLLEFLSTKRPSQPAIGVWPKAQEDTNDTLYHIDQRVMQIIENGDYAVWYTNLGYVKLSSGLVAEVENLPDKRKAFDESGVPVIYLPDDLKSRVEATCKVNRLSPQTVCSFLERGPEQEKLRHVCEGVKQALLEYVISDPVYRGYGAVELFPFEDGTYRAINGKDAFIHRDSEEQALFKLDAEHNIELQKLSVNSRRILESGCSTLTLHPSLKNRSTRDLREYCLRTHFRAFKPKLDYISVNKNLSDFISKVWCWIEARQYKSLDENLCSLWLLPLSDGGYRKIKPSNAILDTIYATTGKLGEFLVSLAEVQHRANKPIIQSNKLSPVATNLLKVAMGSDPSLFIKNSDSLEDFMRWLYKIRNVLNAALPNCKLQLHELISSHTLLCKDRETTSQILNGLEIFKSVLWKPANNEMELYESWVALEKLPAGDKIGLRRPTPTPNVGTVTFLDAQSDATVNILSYFELAECPSDLELMQRYMIPFWEDNRLLRDWTTSGKEKISELLLCNYYRLEGNQRERIRSLAMIPVQCLNGKRSDKFYMARELVDPSVDSLRNLFFADEEVFPAKSILKYAGILMECGLKKALDDRLVIERVKYFARGLQDAKETSKRAQRLLQSHLSRKSGLNNDETLTLQNIRWLPATDPHSLPVLKNAQECRGQDAKLLVGLVFPTLGFEISPDWSSRLGWNSNIPSARLLEQLKSGIKQKSLLIVNAVLRYVQQKDLLEDLRPDLLKLPCIVASDFQLVSVQQAFQKGCDRLQPYIHDVERQFWIEHEVMLKSLGVPEKPTLKDILGVQDNLPSETELEVKHVSIAVKTIELASVFPREQLSSLKVLDDTRRLRAIDNITFHDLPQSEITGAFHSTHPDIAKIFIDKIRIEPLSARVKRGELGISDADEFDQHEDVASAISDTLTRYTIESTFKEFLANAEDCGDAKELNWLLDKRYHPTDSTLSNELRSFQGPALLVHNDGVFREGDFEGLKSVGRGSKRDDDSTIGKFGRGSQTMYHWTDVPMLLSGNWLVILEPSGIKIELSKLKNRYEDQLMPFQGLWGFSPDSDYYHGTIFRFPLRARGSQSKLMEIGSSIDFEAARTCLDNFLEEEGRISLLFIRRIQYMDFKIYGDEKPRWSIRQSPEGECSSGWIHYKITKCMNGNLDGVFTDRWRVAIEDLKKDYSDLPYRYKRTMKKSSCGIAALVPDPLCKQKPIFTNDPVPKFFSSLPLSFQTGLPVHIHASFLLASDRASIPVEDSMQEDGAKWNKRLLSDAIPRSYLNFLADIGREIIHLKDPFEFWPQNPPIERALSEPIYMAFWQMLHSGSYQVFPSKHQIRQAKTGNHTTPELITTTEATFDFLPKAQSSILGDILELHIPKLVRPSKRVMHKLSEMELETVTPKRLCKILKKYSASKHLENITSENPEVLGCLLDIMQTVLEDEFAELNECNILQLADGKFGMLKLSTALNRANHYFLATSEELELFDFASEILISQEDPGMLFKDTVSESAKFNLSRLDLSDMGTLLKRRDFGASASSKEMSTWLAKFWEYCRPVAGQKTPVKSLTSYGEICDYPIFEATCNGIKSYFTPKKWDDFPSVIEPDDPQQLSFCKKFPRIYIFNAHLMPVYLAESENSLKKSASFERFITAISRLANLAGTNLTGYIELHLGITEIKVLRELLIFYVSTRDPKKFLYKKELLKMLPVWPNADSSKSVSAAVAFGTQQSRLLVPWMKDYERFIEPSCFASNIAVLGTIGVSETPGVKVLSEYILPFLPEEAARDLKMYQSLLKGIFRLNDWKCCVTQLRQTRLALNRAGKLHIPGELFDHEDPIFQSAFRNEERDFFLFQKLEANRNCWLAIGLKHRVNGEFMPQDYISCLIRMRNRLESCRDENFPPEILADAQIILQPLTMPSNALVRFNSSDWAIVANQATFPAKTEYGNQYPHRRAQMEVVAAGIPLLQLSEVFAAHYMAVCWSQTSFPLSQPMNTTLSQLNTKGKPPTIMVWRHIQHLSNTVESLAEDSVKEFLSDLYDAYDYLQENLDDSRESFMECRLEHVWFNLELTDSSLIRKADLISCRCAIENLILESTCEAKNLKPVKQGLLRCQRLLRHLNCKSIVYPSPRLHDIPESQLISASLDLLRREEKLLDLTLESRGGPVGAHKVVMAASSEYFKRKYQSTWSDHDTIDLRIFSHSTVSVMVDFAYKDVFDWKFIQLDGKETDAAVADKLDDLLDLLVAADYFEMQNLKDQVQDQILIPAKIFIRESNVLGVRSRASEANADDVEAYCQRFYEKNREAVDLASME